MEIELRPYWGPLQPWWRCDVLPQLGALPCPAFTASQFAVDKYQPSLPPTPAHPLMSVPSTAQPCLTRGLHGKTCKSCYHIEERSKLLVFLKQEVCRRIRQQRYFSLLNLHSGRFFCVCTLCCYFLTPLEGEKTETFVAFSILQLFPMSWFFASWDPVLLVHKQQVILELNYCFWEVCTMA